MSVKTAKVEPKKIKSKGTKAKTDKPKKKKIPHTYRPEGMTLEDWQRALRVQYGEEQPFKIVNTGGHAIFSTFAVSNQESQREYEVEIFTLNKTGNTCSCMDFKTNRLGVCKHISGVLHHATQKRGNKKFIKDKIVPTATGLYIDYTENHRTVKIRLGSEASSDFATWKGMYFDEENRLLPTAFQQFDKVLQEGQAISESFYYKPEVLDLVLKQRDHSQRKEKLAKLFEKGIKSAYFDTLLKAKLYNYQKEGIIFAANAGRCLITDEMGLGKTLQAIGAAELYRKEFGVGKVLIICPTSLKYQWKSEIEKFTEHSSIQVLEGNQLKREQAYKKDDCFYTIATYNILSNDLRLLKNSNYDMIILDEAQRVKNWNTKASIAIKQINTPYCFVLTGTPLENRLEELYSLVQVVDQFRLEPLYQFLNRYQIQNENGKVIGYMNLKEISIKLADILLRRTKKEVLTQMPGRVDKILYVPMTIQQADVHTELKDQVARLVHKWVKYHFLSEQDRRKLLIFLSQMRMVCDSTFVLDEKSRHHTKIQELMSILEEVFTNNPEEKVVIFSQWERMTRLVAEELDSRNIGYCNLNGSISAEKRGKMLEEFREDPEKMVFLSTDAGGVGLNLQSASYVINLDIPWNPAILEQRIARVYRLGQKSIVNVINLVSIATIEHRMLGVLKFKSSVAEGVLDGGDDTLFLSESRFKDFMTSVEAITTTTTHRQEDETGEPVSDAAMPNDEPKPEDEGAVVDENDIAIPNELAQDSLLKNNIEDKKTKAPLPENQPEKQSGISNQPTPQTENSPSPQALIQNGLQFLSGLAQTLQNPAATKELINNITEKSPSDGKTYLKIPIENQAVVENALQLLGNLFAGLAQPSVNKEK